jgi:hypothetical protein
MEKRATRNQKKPESVSSADILSPAPGANELRTEQAA